MRRKLKFVTSNKGKFQEIQAELGIPLELETLDIPEIQSLDLVNITRHKALMAYEILSEPLIVDDTGLQIEAWNGFPGPFIKHILEAGGQELLLRMMHGVENRNARFTTIIGYFDGSHFAHVEGSTVGTIASEIRGEDWGINGIFIPEGTSLTYGELSMADKNKISHRGKATRKLKVMLESEYR